MSDIGYARAVIAKKSHRCEMCYGPIPKGELHIYMHGMYDDQWQNWHAHIECDAAFEDSDDGGFMPGSSDMPERVRKLIEDQKR